MPTIRISDPTLLQLLLADLMSRSDVVADAVGADAITINILGSYDSDALRLVTLLRIRAWEAAQRARGIDVSVEIE